MAEERGLRIGSFAGAPIVIDPNILFLVAYVVGAAALSGGTREVSSALMFLGALMLAVLLHEFGHAGIAAALKLRSKRIVLTFFGGHVEFAEQPRARWQDIAVSAAGPAVNLLCASALPFAVGWFSQFGWPSRDTPLVLNLLDSFFYVSLMLGAFNLLPGFPLDGGRILSAALSYVMRRQRAYLIAAWIGLLVAAALVAVALLQQWWWTVFVGALLALSAWAEIRRARAALQAELSVQSSATSNA